MPHEFGKAHGIGPGQLDEYQGAAHEMVELAKRLGAAIGESKAPARLVWEVVEPMCESAAFSAVWNTVGTEFWAAVDSRDEPSNRAQLAAHQAYLGLPDNHPLTERLERAIVGGYAPHLDLHRSEIVAQLCAEHQQAAKAEAA